MAEVKKTFQTRLTQKEIDFIKDQAKFNYMNPNEFLMQLVLENAGILPAEFYDEEDGK